MIITMKDLNKYIIEKLKLNKDIKPDIDSEIEKIKRLFDEFFEDEKYEEYHDIGYDIYNGKKENTIEFILITKRFYPILSEFEKKIKELKKFIEDNGYIVSNAYFSSNKKISINIIYK